VSNSYDLPRVDHLTVGTVGPVGQRIFLLQARRGVDSVTLKLEKQQVAALSEYLSDLLEKVGRPGELPTDLELELPAEPEWPVGTLGVAYDEEEDTVILVAEEATAAEEEAEAPDGAVARLGATREQAAALAIRGVQLVEAGRPSCPLCGFPLDPSGHACPRSNGHRPPTP